MLVLDYSILIGPKNQIPIDDTIATFAIHFFAELISDTRLRSEVFSDSSSQHIIFNFYHKDQDYSAFRLLSTIVIPPNFKVLKIIAMMSFIMKHTTNRTTVFNKF